MNKPLHFVCVFVVLIGINCTPATENVVKRSEDTGAGNEAIASEEGAAKIVKLPVLDRATRQIIRSYGSTIRKYSEKYGFDWRLSLAVMKAESNFLDSAESHKGAAGLMQIMPSTQEEVARALDINDITEPQSNIRAGIFYLSRLYKMFDDAGENDRLRLTLAAYNAGPGRIFDAQDVAQFMNRNPDRWLAVKEALPLLSSKYGTLHKSVWPNRKPKA
ncbi:MAG: transglycosylase SLT domain-containing protein, partial [bacterium]